MHPTSPDSQVVLCCLYEIRDIAAISTEPCHKWRILRIPIPQLNVVRCQWCSSLAVYIHWEEGYVEIGSIGLRYEVDTVCQICVQIWVRRWGEDSTFIWIVSPTICELLEGFVHNVKSCSIVPWIRVETEIIFNFEIISYFATKNTSPHPEMVLAGLNGCGDITATQFVQEWRTSWRAISDL